MTAADLPATLSYRVAASDERAGLSVLDERTTLAERLVSGGQFEPAPDGDGWHVQWRGAITERWWVLDRDQVAQHIALHRMRADSAAPLTGDDLDAVTAALVALLDARAARPVRTASVQSVEQAVAGRLTRARAGWLDGAGVLRWADRPADPIKTLGTVPEPPAQLPGGGFLDRIRRRDPREHGEPVTPASVQAWCLAHRGIVQPSERPSWQGVVDELRALVTRP